MINRIVLAGRLTRDPELRHTTTGKSVVDFSLAVDKRIKPTDGSATADFFRVQCWGAAAEFVANYMTKGRLVAVDGRLSSRKCTASDGTNREIVEIVADSVQGLDRPRDPEPAKGAAPASAPLPNEDEFDPFADE